jgi:putative oxidoreductase
MLTTHLPFGFSMNWFGNQKGEGYEMDLLIFGMSLALLFIGSGRYSIDRLLVRRAGSSEKNPASQPQPQTATSF